MSTSPEEPPTESSGAGESAGVEPLACTCCRSRKLKCDRRKPICTRCAKVGQECVYPESRRKPAFKRRNVKELEERLAQVEGFLKSAGKRTGASALDDDSEVLENAPSDNHGDGTGDSDLRDIFGTNGITEGTSTGGSRMPFEPTSQRQDSSTSSGSPEDFNASQSYEIFGVGRFESLPPVDMIEALHKIFFETQQSFIPLVHQARYMQAFYATAPHKRPPMCLQYAIWTMASNGHDKYGRYHDMFYNRARNYLETDELRGYGEHFISLAHAQAWALVGTNEARSMHFTRAAMSSARCVRLCEMMGFHRLDDPSGDENPMVPTINPPHDWIELEERRRVFWGAFCMDSHASISTGWPTLIDMGLVTTRLPASEDAFNSGKEEEAATLQSVFSGSVYSTFAATVVTCHIFTQLLKHVHRPMPDDHPEELSGNYWKRHRELDNLLSSAFMFLPERFRLPKFLRDPVAIYQNLNLHASVICLHNAACEKADKYKLPDHIKQISRTRCLTAALEIVNILKLTSHVSTRYKSPLVALSLYTAATVFVSQAKENPEECDSDNLSFLITCMEAIGRQHIITRAYLHQLRSDIQNSGIDAHGVFSTTQNQGLVSFNPCGYNIPMLVRSSSHAKPNSLLPGRLPLGGPDPAHFNPVAYGRSCGWTLAGIKKSVRGEGSTDPSSFDESDAPGSKRKRTSLGPGSGDRVSGMPPFRAQNVFEQSVVDYTDGGSTAQGRAGPTAQSKPDHWVGFGAQGPLRLPHRTNTPSASVSPPSASGGAPTVPTVPTPSRQDGMMRFSMMGPPEFLYENTVIPTDLPVDVGVGSVGVLGNIGAADLLADPNLFQGMDRWDNISDLQAFTQMAAAMMQENGGSNSADGFSTSQEEADQWTQLIGGSDNLGGGGWDPSSTGQGSGNG